MQRVNQTFSGPRLVIKAPNSLPFVCLRDCQLAHCVYDMMGPRPAPSRGPYSTMSLVKLM